MDTKDIDQIFELAKLVRKEKVELMDELEKVRLQIKKNKDTLTKLYTLVR